MAANPVPPQQPRPLRSAKSTIVSWVDQAVNGGNIPVTNVKISDIADEVRTRFLSDPVFAERFAAECLDDMLQVVIREVVAQTRGQYRREISGDTIVSPQQFVMDGAQALGARLSSKWASWLEHSGDQHIRLTSMRRKDLLAAAAERRRRADLEIEKAQLLEALADLLPDDSTEVGQAFSLAQIELVSDRIKAKNDGRLPADAPIFPDEAR